MTRAQGCLLGQLAGDALGSLVEFRAPQDIRREYPNGVRELANGGTWNTIAGQPTVLKAHFWTILIRCEKNTKIIRDCLCPSQRES